MPIFKPRALDHMRNPGRGGRSRSQPLHLKDPAMNSKPNLGRKLACAGVAAASFAAVVMTPIAVGTPTASAAGSKQLKVGSYNIRAGVSTSTFSSALHSVLP